MLRRAHKKPRAAPWLRSNPFMSITPDPRTDMTRQLTLLIVRCGVSRRTFEQCQEDARAVDDVREHLRACQRALDFSMGR